MALLRNVARLPYVPSRAFASDSAPPLIWKLAHGMFDAETPMTEKMAGIPDPTPIDAPSPSTPQTSTLPNGVRVVSQDLGGPVTSLALFIAAGSRHENPYTSGASFLLERLAFKGSNERSKFRMVRDMERTGAIFNAAAARESIAYATEGLRTKVPDMISIISETATAPISAPIEHGSVDWDLTMDEIKTQKDIIKKDLETLSNDPNNVVTEAIHSVAFHGNTLGLPLIPSEHRLDSFSPETVQGFASEHFTPDRLVIAASNYDHEELVELAKSTLGDVTGTSGGVAEARYTGGGTKIGSNGPAQVAIGFKGVAWSDPDLVPICILHSLLGGGGSFSSGGPGKGMYTRLYSQVLNQQAWVTSAMSFNHCYSDTGIFGIQASCDDPAQLNALIEVVGTQIGRMSGPLSGGELARAKAMTKSSLIMNLESRAVVCEDLGRQILSSGSYQGPAELVKKIDAITEDDIRRVAARVLDSTPSVVTYGEEYETQPYTAIESAIKSQAKIAA